MDRAFLFARSNEFAKNKMQISSVPVLRTVVDGAPASIVCVQESKLDCVPQELMLSLPMDQIWRERNARVFRGASESVQHLLVAIRREAQSWTDAGAAKLGCLFCE